MGTFRRLTGAVAVMGLVFVAVNISCSSAPQKGETTFDDITAPAGTYAETLDKWTQTAKSYNGIMATFQITATLMANEVIEHQELQDAKQFHWTSDQLKDERQKALYEAQSNTTVFVSFFTEMDEENNLDKSSSVWNMYLETGGARVKATSVKHSYENKVVLANKYPYHNVWSKAYIMKFPVSTATASDGATFVIAGPVGSAQLKFPKER